MYSTTERVKVKYLNRPKQEINMPYMKANPYSSKGSTSKGKNPLKPMVKETRKSYASENPYRKKSKKAKGSKY
jgi:hypothetical protein